MKFYVLDVVPAFNEDKVGQEFCWPELVTGDLSFAACFLLLERIHMGHDQPVPPLQSEIRCHSSSKLIMLVEHLHH